MKRFFLVSLMVLGMMLSGVNTYALINPGDYGIPSSVLFELETGLSTYAGTCEYIGFSCIKNASLDFDDPINPEYVQTFPAEAMAVVLRSSSIPADSNFRMPPVMVAKEETGIQHDIMIAPQMAVYSPENSGYIVYCFISTMVPQDHVRVLSGLFHNDGCDYVLENLGSIPTDPQVLSNKVANLAQQYMVSQNINEPPLPSSLSTQCQQLLDDLSIIIQNGSPYDLEGFGNALRDIDKQADTALSDQTERQYFYGATYVTLESGRNWTSIANGGNSGWNHLKDPPDDDEATLDIDWREVVRADLRGFIGGGIKGAIISSVCNLVKQILF